MSHYQEFINRLREREMGIDEKARLRNVANNNEEGIVHETSHAGMTISEDGDINIGSLANLGIMINRESESMIVTAPNLYIFSNNIEQYEIMDIEQKLPTALKEIEERVKKNE